MSVEISKQELALLLDGIDFTRLRRLPSVQAQAALRALVVSDDDVYPLCQTSSVLNVAALPTDGTRRETREECLAPRKPGCAPAIHFNGQ